MKESPIIFTTENVRAILDGRKTQTRRVVKPQPINYTGINVHRETIVLWQWQMHKPEGFAGMPEHIVGNRLKDSCPYGQVGDRLWVRETHYRHGFWSKEPKVLGKRQSYSFVPMDEEKFPIRYYDNPPDVIYKLSQKYALGYFKRPSIFMPRWASRITLKITGVRVERLQEIPLVDVKKEGITDINWYYYDNAIDAFKELWDSINAKRGYGWDKNPWCWVIEFRRPTDA